MCLDTCFNDGHSSWWSCVKLHTLFFHRPQSLTGRVRIHRRCKEKLGQWFIDLEQKRTVPYRNQEVENIIPYISMSLTSNGLLTRGEMPFYLLLGQEKVLSLIVHLDALDLDALKLNRSNNTAIMYSCLCQHLIWMFLSRRHEYPYWVWPGSRTQNPGSSSASLPEVKRPRQCHPHLGGCQGNHINTNTHLENITQIFCPIYLYSISLSVCDHGLVMTQQLKNMGGMQVFHRPLWCVWLGVTSIHLNTV